MTGKLTEAVTSGQSKRFKLLTDGGRHRYVSSSQLGEASESADALSSSVVATSAEESHGGGEAQVVTANASHAPSFLNVSSPTDVAGKARGEAGERNALHTRCPPRVATSRSQEEQAA